MYSQAMVSPALMHNLGLPSGLPWLKASHARVIGSLKRAESSPALGCSPGKHGAVSCLPGAVERILTQTAPVSLVLHRRSKGSSALCWRRESLRRLNGFGVLCRRRPQLARCACSTLVLSVLA